MSSASRNVEPNQTTILLNIVEIELLSIRRFVLVAETLTSEKGGSRIIPSRIHLTLSKTNYQGKGHLVIGAGSPSKLQADLLFEGLRELEV